MSHSLENRQYETQSAKLDGRTKKKKKRGGKSMQGVSLCQRARAPRPGTTLSLNPIQCTGPHHCNADTVAATPSPRWSLRPLKFWTVRCSGETSQRWSYSISVLLLLFVFFFLSFCFLLSFFFNPLCVWCLRTLAVTHLCFRSSLSLSLGDGISPALRMSPWTERNSASTPEMTSRHPLIARRASSTQQYPRTDTRP